MFLFGGCLVQFVQGNVPGEVNFIPGEMFRGNVSGYPYRCSCSIIGYVAVIISATLQLTHTD